MGSGIRPGTNERGKLYLEGSGIRPGTRQWPMPEKEGIVDVQRRKRFELRITDEDRQRLRTLAEQQATTESAAIRALIREANIRLSGEGMEAKEEAVAA